MFPNIQVSCEIQVELTRFYNVDLFHRGYYQLRVSLDSQNRDRRVQLSIDRAAEQNYPEGDTEVEKRQARARRVQCPVLPSCISADGQTAYSKTFLIFYKHDCITLNDVFKFRLDVLQAVESVEEQFVKAGVMLKMDLWYADEDESSDELSLRSAMQSVAQRTLRVNTDLRNGVHAYIPCTFDYYHLGTVCANVHATLLNVQLPTFRAMLPGGSGNETPQNMTFSVPQGDVPTETLESVLFEPVTIVTANGNANATVNGNGNASTATSDSEKRERHRRAFERYSEICTVLLGAQESLRRQLFELRRLVPNALDVRTSSAGLAARLEAMCEAVQVAAEESELVETVAGDLALLSAEIRVLWSHYLAIVTLNPLVTQHYAVRYQQLRVRRLAEGFLTVEYRKQQLFDPRERTLMPHDELANMIRSSAYFQAMLPMPLECAETDGTPSTMPLVFEEVFVDDQDACSTAVVDPKLKPLTAGHPHSVSTSALPLPSATLVGRPTAFISNSLELPAETSGKRDTNLLAAPNSTTGTSNGDNRMVRSASASKTSLLSPAGSPLKLAHADAMAMSDTEAEVRGDRADLIRIAHATNLQNKQSLSTSTNAPPGSQNASGNTSDEDATLTLKTAIDEHEPSAAKSDTQSQSESKGRLHDSSNQLLGILDMLDQAASLRSVTAADILASRSNDRQRIDYLREFEQRAQLAGINQPITLATQLPFASENGDLEQSTSNTQAQRSIVAPVSDRLVRFIRLKEEFKRRLAQVYNGHVCSDLAFAAATCPYFWAPPTSSKLLAPQPPSDPGLHLVVCVHGMDGFAHDLRSVRVAIEQSLPATRFDFLLSKRNQRETSHEFDVLGERLVSEILQHIDSRGAMPGRISFVGFSLGNVIIRTALSSPGLQHLLPKLHTFVSLAGPHLGVLYQTSTIVGVGTWLVRKWKKSESLVQLCLKDHADLRQTFVYRLSRCAGLALFRYVLLISSPQDHYVPRHSARLELAANVVRDSSELGRVYIEMLANLLSPLTTSRTQLVRYDTVFALPNDTNAFIGRAAHCAVMENELFLEKLFTVSAAKYFR